MLYMIGVNFEKSIQNGKYIHVENFECKTCHQINVMLLCHIFFRDVSIGKQNELHISQCTPFINKERLHLLNDVGFLH